MSKPNICVCVCVCGFPLDLLSTQNDLWPCRFKCKPSSSHLGFSLLCYRLRLQLTFISIIDLSANYFLHWSSNHLFREMSKKVKNAHFSFPELNVTSSNYFFCPNKSPKHNDSSFIIINDTKSRKSSLKSLNQWFFFMFICENDSNN